MDVWCTTEEESIIIYGNGPASTGSKDALVLEREKAFNMPPHNTVTI